MFNGEVYNHAALRAELERLGYPFKTHSDTEVVAYAYLHWGLAALDRLRGMFALALWDARAARLVLARDRLGVKPLFYARHAGQLLFGSEVKALLAAGLPARADPAALGALFDVGFVPGPGAFFAGVSQVPPGHLLVADAAAGTFDVRRWWRLEWPAPDGHAPTPAEAVAGFCALLQESIALRRADEVPLGALLSGGLDSASIVALLKPLRAEPTHTFSIGFPVPAYDESARARRTAEFLGTTHHALEFSADDFNRYPELMWHLESPQCAATALPIYLLYEACRAAGFKVILTGEGADELLGGYGWYRGDRLARPLLAAPGWLRRGLARLAPMSPGARRVLRAGRPADVAGRFALWLQVADPAARGALLAPDYAPGAGAESAGARWRAAWGAEVAGLAPLHALIHVDTHTRLADFINFEVDRLSMAHSIEARAPFLDYRLWEYCAALPPGLKLGAREKQLLRLAVRAVLPREVVTRPKQGLAAPYARWLAAPRLPDFAETALAPATVRGGGYFRPEAVTQLRAAHAAGQAGAGAVLMGVLSVQVWHAVFVERVSLRP